MPAREWPEDPNDDPALMALERSTVWLNAKNDFKRRLTEVGLIDDFMSYKEHLVRCLGKDLNDEDLGLERPRAWHEAIDRFTPILAEREADPESSRNRLAVTIQIPPDLFKALRRRARWILKEQGAKTADLLNYEGGDNDEEMLEYEKSIGSMPEDAVVEPVMEEAEPAQAPEALSPSTVPLPAEAQSTSAGGGAKEEEQDAGTTVVADAGTTVISDAGMDEEKSTRDLKRDILWVYDHMDGVVSNGRILYGPDKITLKKIEAPSAGAYALLYHVLTDSRVRQSFLDKQLPRVIPSLEKSDYEAQMYDDGRSILKELEVVKSFSDEAIAQHVETV